MQDTGAHPPFLQCIWPRPLIIKISYLVYYSAQRERTFTEVTKRHCIESPMASGSHVAFRSLTPALWLQRP